MPANDLPFILSLPHCSDTVPDDFRPRLALDQHAIKQSRDHGTSEVFGDLPAREVVRARVSRLVSDLNRREDDLGPKGVVASLDYCQRDIFRPGRKPDPAMVRELISLYHRPFHERLSKAIRKNRFLGLIDCHSLDGTGPPGAPDRGQSRSDLTLGNNGDERGDPRDDRPEGTSCPREKFLIMAEAFERQGFSVSLNLPYSGGFITRHYGPSLSAEGKFAVQIEMNKDLIWDPGEWKIIPQRAEDVRERVLAAMLDMASRLESLAPAPKARRACGHSA